MFNMKQFIQNIGFDNLALGLTGLVAIAIAVSDFVGWIQLSVDQLLKMILVATGLLMAAIVSQALRRASEIKELRGELGVAEIRVIDSEKTFPQSLVSSISKTKNFVLDTAFNFQYSSESTISHDNYKLILYRRVRRGEIRFRRVEVIYNKERLKHVIRNLLRHEGSDYFIRYYDSPPKAIPLLNMMSFDDEHFYLGGYHTAESVAEEYVLFIRHPLVTQFLRSYWNVLWLSATPLNEGKRINWNELKQIAMKVGLKEDEYKTLLEESREEVEAEMGQSNKKIELQLTA